MDKRTVVKIFIAFYEKLPQQGTLDWLKGRNERFGGSELGTLFGFDSYNTPQSKILEKIGVIKKNMEEFRTIVYMNWGNNFEIVHQFVLELLFDTLISELKSIPWHCDKTFDHLDQNEELIKSSCIHISPDGLAVINKHAILNMPNIKYIKNYMSDDVRYYLEELEDDEIYVMFEQKAPYSRQLKPEIPKYYEPQVSGGMCVIPFVQLSIYTESVFRFVKVKDLLTNNHNNINMPFNQKKITTEPYKRGLIGYYAKIGTDKFAEIVKKYTISDITELPIEETFELFKLVKLRTYVDVKVYIADDSKNNLCIKAVKNDSNISDSDYVFLGFIGWHLYELTFHFLKPDMNYLHDKYEIISESTKLINEMLKYDLVNDEEYICKCVDDFVNKKIFNNITS